MSARICTRRLASRFDSGSSIRKTCGWRTIARPIATRWRCPPESWRGLRASSPLPRALEVVPRHQNVARAAVAYSVAGACTHVRMAVIAGNSFRPQEATDRLCFQRVPDNHESHSIHQPAHLAERERVRLGAGLEERDLQRP